MDALTRRRLGGAVLVLVGIVVAVLVLVSAGDDKPTATAKKKGLPIRIVSVPPVGLGFAHPTTWRRSVSGSVISLRSPEGSIALFFSSPATRPAVEEVTAEARAEMLERFKPATVVGERRQPLGRRSVRSFELRGTDKGAVVRALEMVDSTDYRTYAVTLLTGPKPSARRLREAREILATVRFSKPQAVPSNR